MLGLSLFKIKKVCMSCSLFNDPCIGDPSVCLSLTLSKNEKVEHYIRIKVHKSIALKFWVKSGVNPLYVW